MFHEKSCGKDRNKKKNQELNITYTIFVFSHFQSHLFSILQSNYYINKIFDDFT